MRPVLACAASGEVRIGDVIEPLAQKFALTAPERAALLPRWFEVNTPVGKYNPDWAIVKQGDDRLYLVRETKGTKDFLKLRNSEADKVRCGQKHFEALGVDFNVVVSADQV